MKRKEETIDNTLNSDDLNDYQVRVNVQYYSDMNNDFSDLRLTESDGQTSTLKLKTLKVPSKQPTSRLLKCS